MAPLARDAPVADARSIAIRRMSAGVARRLRAAPAEAGRVHSVFERAVNLAWHDGRLLTLQAPGPLRAPFAAALTRLPHPGAVRAGMPVWRRGDALALAGCVVRWSDAAVAETAMPASHAGPGPALSRLPTALFAASAPGLSSSIAIRARARMAEALRRRDAAAFLEGAEALVGLGEGLTPAGDDCLVGVLAAIHRFARPWLSEHPEIRDALERTAAVGTTAVAREFVAHAAAGHFAEALIDLLTADSDAGAARAAARLRDSGATSGADTLVGLHLALTALDGALDGVRP